MWSGRRGALREARVLHGAAGRENRRLPRADPGRAARPGTRPRRARPRACRRPRPAVTRGHVLGPLPWAAGGRHRVARSLAERTRRHAGALRAGYAPLVIGRASRGPDVTADATPWGGSAGRPRPAALGARPRLAEGDVSGARARLGASRVARGVPVARIHWVGLGVHVSGVHVGGLRRAPSAAAAVVRMVPVVVVPAGVIPAPAGRDVAVRVVGVPVSLWVRGSRGPASRTPTGAAAWTFHPAPPGPSPKRATERASLPEAAAERRVCAMHTPHHECRPQRPCQRGRPVNGLVR
jgi:hypothetical protein